MVKGSCHYSGTDRIRAINIQRFRTVYCNLQLIQFLDLFQERYGQRAHTSSRRSSALACCPLPGRQHSLAGLLDRWPWWSLPSSRTTPPASSPTATGAATRPPGRGTTPTWMPSLHIWVHSCFMFSPEVDQWIIFWIFTWKMMYIAYCVWIMMQVDGKSGPAVFSSMST